MTNELIMAVTASITAFGVLGGVIVAIYRVAKKISDAVGLDSHGRTLSERLERVEHQLWENGGSSLADRVNNIEKHVVKVSTEIEFIKDLTMGMHAAQSGPTTTNVYPPEPSAMIQPIKRATKRRNVG
jgi:hypothetical protein